MNVGKFENGSLAGEWNNPNNDLLLSCIPSSSNSDSDNSSNGTSLACLNYEFDIISETNNNNSDTSINNNMLNNFSNKVKLDIAQKSYSSSSNVNQFYFSAADATSTHSNLRNLPFCTNDANEPHCISRSDDVNNEMMHDAFDANHKQKDNKNSNVNNINTVVELSYNET